MVNTTPQMKELYRKIQQKLFYMIPEKWDKIYLYASVMEGINHLETGEMFFYYFPKGLLKREPINVYEVPNRFNLDEKEYFALADELYGILKTLRREFAKANKKKWSNLTISIENFKFMVEYDYEDLKASPYSSYDRHVIWRYEYLKTSMNMYNKKERKILSDYLENMPYVSQEKKDTYVEGIYNVQGHNQIGYNKAEQYVTSSKRAEQTEIQKEKEPKQEEKKNQILNFDHKI